jgi:hypothetical protein
MKTNSSVLSGKFWLAAVTVALFLFARYGRGSSGKQREGQKTKHQPRKSWRDYRWAR